MKHLCEKCSWKNPLGLDEEESGKEANIGSASSVNQQLPVIWLGWASIGRFLLFEPYEKIIHKKRTIAFNWSKNTLVESRNVACVKGCIMRFAWTLDRPFEKKNTLYSVHLKLNGVLYLPFLCHPKDWLSKRKHFIQKPLDSIVKILNINRNQIIFC